MSPPPEATRKTGKAHVVNQSPDVCLTPMGSSMVPVPYQIVAVFEEAVRLAETVFMTKLPAFNTSSRIPTVKGNEAGSGGGVASGVNVGWCRPSTFSSTVRVEKKNVVRHDDKFEMNAPGPDGTSNTVGKAIYMESGDAESTPPQDVDTAAKTAKSSSDAVMLAGTGSLGSVAINTLGGGSQVTTWGEWLVGGGRTVAGGAVEAVEGVGVATIAAGAAILSVLSYIVYLPKAGESAAVLSRMYKERSDEKEKGGKETKEETLERKYDGARVKRPKYRPKTKGANKEEKKLLDEIARRNGIKQRDKFGRFIEKNKRGESRENTDNPTRERLEELAIEFLELGGK